MFAAVRVILSSLNGYGGKVAVTNSVKMLVANSVRTHRIDALPTTTLGCSKKERYGLISERHEVTDVQIIFTNTNSFIS